MTRAPRGPAVLARADPDRRGQHQPTKIPASPARPGTNLAGRGALQTPKPKTRTAARRFRHRNPKTCATRFRHRNPKQGPPRGASGTETPRPARRASDTETPRPARRASDTETQNTDLRDALQTPKPKHENQNPSAAKAKRTRRSRQDSTALLQFFHCVRMLIEAHPRSVTVASFCKVRYPWRLRLARRLRHYTTRGDSVCRTLRPR